MLPGLEYIHTVAVYVVSSITAIIHSTLYFYVELPHENETNGYIFIHAEGGLNQQRIAV